MQKDQAPFEDFWYADGKAVEMPPSGKLAIPPGEVVTIKVTQRQDCIISPDENRAVGGALARVVLSLLLHHDQVSQVILPDTSYWPITAELQSRKGILLPSSATPPPEARIWFEVHSASSNIKRSIYFL